MNRQHSMDCVDFKVILSPYIDGELAAETRFAADRHLIECGNCRSLLERAESNDEAIRGICLRDPEFAQQIAGPIGLPAEFESEVLSRVQRRRTIQWQRMRGSLGLLAAAAALALGAALWTIWPTQTGNGDRSGSGTSEPVNDGDFEQLDPRLHGPPTLLHPREFARSSPALNSDELQSLHGTAILLQSIAATPFEDIAARTQLRQMSVYDELIERLGAIQPRFDTIDRRTIAAARAVLFELQREHVDLAAWNTLQDDLRAYELARDLEVIASSAESHTGA